MDYRIKLDIFDGPFDLLLHLIKINEMDIYDIQISDITRQFLEYIGLMKQLDLNVGGDFLVMAATLIKLKLRELLPTVDEEEAEEIDIISSREELIRQLIEYRRYKEIAQTLREREQEYGRFTYRQKPLPVSESGEEALKPDLQLLFSAFSRVIRYVDRPDYQLFAEEFNVEDKMEYIRNLLSEQKQVQFFPLFAGCTSKDEAITTFLAILELCRLGEVRITQRVPFTDILIKPARARPKPLPE